MKRGSIAVPMAFVLAYILGISSVSASSTYKMTLESGAVYQSERVDDDTANILNSSGEQVGSVTVLDDGGYEVFDAGGDSLGTAPYLNPDALKLIDARVTGGGA